MKRQIIGLLTVLTLLFGCGSGGSGSESQTNNNDDSKEVEEITKNIFEYPDYFKDYSTFKGMSTLNNGLSLPYVATDGLKLIGIETLSRMVGTTFGFVLKSVDTEAKLSRASCEQGSLTVNNYTYDIYAAEDISGDFEMSDFSGPMTQLEGDVLTKCSKNNYYDGSIVYNFEGNSSLSTFGKLGKPFFYNGSDGNFDGADGYLGTLTSTNNSTFTIDGTFEYFTVHTDAQSGNYQKSSYKKDDLLIYKNLTYSNVTSGNETVIDANYERQWQEHGETFILHTTVSNVIIGTDKTIVSGSAKYNLSVIGKSDKYINVDVIYGTDVKVTYDKEGVISKNF